MPIRKLPVKKDTKKVEISKKSPKIAGFDIQYNFIKPIKPKSPKKLILKHESLKEICKIPEMKNQRDAIISEIKKVENKIIDQKPKFAK